MENKAVFSQSFDIQSHHIYQNFEVTMPYLLGCMQQAADSHVDSCSIGWNDLHAKGCFWAIYRLGVRIERMPRKYDVITVRTWANPPRGVMQPRSFEVLDRQGNRLAYAQSLWIILDEKDFRPQAVEEVIGTEIAYRMGEDDAFNINLKIGSVKTEGIQPAVRDVLYSDIDTNRHVNNTNYVKWLLDSYPAEFLETHQLAGIDLNFTQQARLGDRYAVFINKSNDSQHLAVIANTQNSDEFCKLRAFWSSRQ